VTGTDLLADLARGGRLAVRYAVTGGSVREVAEAIRVEQTIEFPLELVRDPVIREVVVGRVEELVDDGSDAGTAVISYDPGVVGGELSQLLNILWGNVSLFPGVRVVGVELPASLLAAFPGPGFGVAGLRALLDLHDRPILATAVKPMGTSPAGLAHMAATIAQAGFDIVKDDHGLADQPWAPWLERVRICADAVRGANERTGGRCLYMPSLNVPADRLAERAHAAAEAGAGAVLVLPGIAGLDAVRALAADPGLGLPVMAHPSFQGSLVVNPGQGLRHGLVFGLLDRLAGVDLSVFPNYGGRFSFTPQECLDIAAECRRPRGDLAPAWPAPGGGMTLERVGELVDFYGNDVALLIGGALHRGDLGANARALVERVRSAAGSTGP
jgi:ribulose-bisphosphate carboxylase large chain